jgi:cell division protein FtsB|tara:strand:+ start:13355 stop:13801 length:447 start_codon:yes stop_codon:yes gene_type:complete
MSYQHLEPLSKQLTIVIGLSVVGFMAFGLALSFYRNLLFEQTLEGISEQNGVLREAIDQGYRDLEYFRSSQYKDKYAKENLNIVRPGEKTLIITQIPNDVFVLSEPQLEPTQQQEAAYFELLRQMPTLEHWKLYLFHREKIEEIKMGL